MKKKSSQKKTTTKKSLPVDFGEWNFIVFLTLSLILIVFITATINNQMRALKAKASYACPDVRTLPRPEDCPGGAWKYYRDANGCQQFMCPTR